MALTTAQALGSRLRAARERRGLSQQALADAVGLDRTMVNRIEGGQRKVTALELAAIADALQARMQSFFTDPAPSIVSHRSAQGLDATESAVDHLLTELAAAVEFLHGLRPIQGLATREPWEPPTSTEAVEGMAARARAEAGYGPDEPAKNLQDHLATAGLLVFSQDFGADAADAGSVLLEEGGVAIVNSAPKVGRRRLSAVHEFGHYLLADEYTVDWRTAHTGPDIEGRIDRFARAFLLPATAMASVWPRAVTANGTRTAAVTIAGSYLVDMSTLARRLQDLDLVDASTANDIRAVQTTQTDIVTHDLYPSHELEGLTQPRTYQKHVLALFEAERISRDRALGLLGGTFTDADLPELPPRQEQEIWEYVS
ncbi:helix-turn-helix domain-containing protein [Micrococcus flavus]|uniref:Zn-dependent peptidase ImmA (M78 family)/DNA-binding XRE family transcriptional regulator n=1 Tax=Micrococcus flavus TaxID=384602 RepID=A0A4Y8X1E9_9MICC|nr:helix-turn-helix domain-containing protein [Micrococcus flavus]MBB4883622.1 Zn-dependent peptidase ImmA (M78 family)/DNA-binding XRE family transcriptional regulator [Micrococcus flavus]TFI02440.1 helix-turn-helix domain-containing protein [Micrococcus flavus]GGK52972.1 hypothetical protein GCM10007073_20020 [Micrococcus flavus]